MELYITSMTTSKRRPQSRLVMAKPDSQCAACGKPATNKCKGCSCVVYCNKDCQSNNWEEHKKVCKALQLGNKLKRIATTVHAAYLKLRENTWDTPIDSIEENEDALIIYDGKQAHKKHHFIDFPHGLVDDAQSKMAVLCTLTCNEPLAWMHDMLKNMVKGLPVTIEEIEVRLQQIPRKVTAVHPSGYRQDNWPGYSHFLLRLTSTKSTFQWVMDIAGGQFGICTPLWSWKLYSQRFINTLKPINIYPFGTNKAVLHALGKLDGNPSLTYGLGETAAVVMDEAIASFEKSLGLTLPKLLKLSEEDYAVHQEAVLDAITMALCDYKKNQSGEIMAIWQASRNHENRFPGQSGQKCMQAMPKLFERCCQATK